MMHDSTMSVASERGTKMLVCQETLAQTSHRESETYAFVEHMVDELAMEVVVVVAIEYSDDG